MSSGKNKPRIVVSRCLGFAHCRYDGSVIPAPVVDSLRDFVEFVPVCPELELGLGAPRPPVRLVWREGEIRLLQPETGRDLTEAMQALFTHFSASLPPVDGFILKHRSPSCGIKDAKVYPYQGKGGVLGRRAGMFGQAVKEQFSDLPVEDEGRLTNLQLREHFFTAVFALAELRAVQSSQKMGDLVRFHSRYKLLLMALSQVRLRELGRIVANPEKRPVAEVMERYGRTFRVAMARPFRRPAAINVLLHAFGYFSDQLSPGEKAYFLDLLAHYREGKVPLSAPVSVLRAWIIRFEESYLADQSFFFPYPEPLVSLENSGKSREAR
ncbi:MAG: DUF523 and DUF1722 domain-containing protein [Anaerolineae bacterium]|nr:DUF523 and DUF1722 domain-containing protein [Anaerolineae bacterium]